MLVSTLFIKEMWTLIPWSASTHKLFPFSDVMITNQTYYSYACHYAVALVVSMVIYDKFDQCKSVFGPWMILNALEFIEYFVTYNQPLAYVTAGDHKFHVTITNIRYIVISILTIHKLLTWKT